MDVMSQFMDVITTFKCKVCEFVCTKQTELFDHVKTEHLPSTSAKSSGTSLDVCSIKIIPINIQLDKLYIPTSNVSKCFGGSNELFKNTYIL